MSTFEQPKRFGFETHYLDTQGDSKVEAMRDKASGEYKVVKKTYGVLQRRIGREHGILDEDVEVAITEKVIRQYIKDTRTAHALESKHPSWFLRDIKPTNESHHPYHHR